jgi:hypothetical protein
MGCGRIGFQPESLGGEGLGGIDDIDDGIASGVCEARPAGTLVMAAPVSSTGEPVAAWNGTTTAVVLGATFIDSQIVLLHLDPDGLLVGSEVNVAIGTTPTVAWNGAGYGVAWTDSRYGLLGEIFFRALDATGAPRGQEVRITTTPTSSNEPTLLWMGDHFVIGWREGDFDYYTMAIDADGTPLTAARSFLAGTSGSRIDSDIEIIRAGTGMGVAWTYGCCDGEEYVHVAIGDSMGARTGSDVQIDGNSANQPFLAWNGEVFGYVWARGNDAWFATIDASGTVTNEQSLGLPGGVSALAWDGTRFAGLGFGVAEWIAITPASGISDRKSLGTGPISVERASLRWTTSGYIGVWSDAGTLQYLRICP